MNKLKFILELHDKLSFLSADDIEKSVEYYSEIIDDYVEDGLSEDDAVAALGDVDTIVSSILAETPMTHIIKQRIKPRRRLGALEIILLILGSPIWISLGLAFLAVTIAETIARADRRIFTILRPHPEDFKKAITSLHFSLSFRNASLIPSLWRIA